MNEVAKGFLFGLRSVTFININGFEREGWSMEILWGQFRLFSGISKGFDKAIPVSPGPTNSTKAKPGDKNYYATKTRKQ